MDRRTARKERSKKALKDTFLALLKTKEPEDITIVELCQNAGLNRSTFYAHYKYIDELVEEVLWENVKQIFDNLGTQWDLDLENGGVARNVIASYLHLFVSNTMIRRFCTCKNSGNYRENIIRAHIDLTLGSSKNSISYFAAYYQNAGVLNFLLEWLNNGTPIPEEKVIDIIHEFSKVMYLPWE